MGEKNIIQLIKSFDLSQLKPVVFVYGTEDFLKKQLLDKLKETTDTHIFWGDETGFSQITDLFSSSSLFSEGNTAVILEFDSFISKLSKEEIKSFSQLLQNLHTPDRLFLISKKEKIPAKEPYRSIREIAEIVISPPLTLRAFMISIQKKIQKEGKEINEENLKYLALKLKNDLWLAKQEIEKLLTFVSDKKEITKEDIDATVVPKISENVFVFLDRFFSKDKEVLRIYKNLVETTHHPFEIQSLLLNQINKVLQFKTLVESGKSQESVFEQMGIKHQVVKASIQKQASLVTKEELISMIKNLHNVEKMQKVEYLDVKRSFEEFLIKQVAQ